MNDSIVLPALVAALVLAQLAHPASLRADPSHDEAAELHVTMPDAVATERGVRTETAGPHELERVLRLTGRIGLAAQRLATLRPRFASMVVDARATVGERVRRGDVLATLESSASLSRYSLWSPIDGIVLERRAIAGTAVGEGDALYTIADLSRVQADFDVYGQDALLVRPGAEIGVRDDVRGIEARTTVLYVSPLRDAHTQTTLARAELDNADGSWAPGAFVFGMLGVDEKPAAVAVPPSALQTLRGRDTVFVRTGGGWEATAVRLGRRSERWVEVLEGIDPGTDVATGNTFLLRAEIEKAGAAHDD